GDGQRQQQQHEAGPPPQQQPQDEEAGSKQGTSCCSSSSSVDSATINNCNHDNNFNGSSGTVRGCSSNNSTSCRKPSSAVSSWRALSVTSLHPGDRVYVVRQAAARHTGIAIEEFIVEK
ncbi:hypothetical protein Agub_g6921, partial [Astrephomene gubernaculifera]